MKIHLERNVLFKALVHSHSVVEKKTTVPVLSHVLIQADGATQVKLTSTDLELSLVEEIEGTVEHPGAVAVVEHMLYEIVRRLPDGSKITLELETGQAQVLLISGASRFTLSYLPAQEFPTIQIQPLPHQFSIPTKDLLRLIDRAKFAMSTEETRYYLNGIYLHPHASQELRGVATDGHRLAQVSVPLPAGAADFPGIILSRKTVNEVMKICGTHAQDVEISLSETQISLKFETIFLTSRLIDGTFPDYEKAIPWNNQKTLTLSIIPFMKAVERVSIISADHSKGLKMKVVDNKIILSTVSSDIGSAHEEVDAQYNNEPLEIGFNSRYLLDIADQIGHGEAEFCLANANTAVIIRNKSDAQVLYILMPMRV